MALRAGAALWVDVSRYHELLTQVASHSHPPQRLCDACLTALSEAAELYGADFLAGFTLADTAEFDDWQAFQTESLRLEFAGVLRSWRPGWLAARTMSQLSATPGAGWPRSAARAGPSPADATPCVGRRPRRGRAGSIRNASRSCRRNWASSRSRKPRRCSRPSEAGRPGSLHPLSHSPSRPLPCTTCRPIPRPSSAANRSWRRSRNAWPIPPAGC